jgi:hypothetical protein
MLQEGQLTVITIGSVPSKAASQHKVVTSDIFSSLYNLFSVLAPFLKILSCKIQLRIYIHGVVPRFCLQNEKAAKECGLPVIMPGDNIAKFFARPCPHETCLPATEKAELEVQVRCSVS